MNELPETYLKKCNKIEEFKTNPPNLQELYDICKALPRFVSSKDLDFLSKMRICISNLCCNSYLKNQSMYDFWLMFYMKEKYGLEWFEQCNAWK